MLHSLLTFLKIYLFYFRCINVLPACMYSVMHPWKTGEKLGLPLSCHVGAGELRMTLNLGFIRKTKPRFYSLTPRETLHTLACCNDLKRGQLSISSLSKMMELEE